MTRYALSQDEANTWLSNDERVLELSAKLDAEKQEKMFLLKRHETVEHNLHSVQNFLGNEKVALKKIMEGARKKLDVERAATSSALQQIEIERTKSAHLAEELQMERQRCIVLKDGLNQALAREDMLRAVLTRQQVKVLYHILNNIEVQRYMHFFSLWRKFTNDSQTLQAAEDLRRMTDSVDRHSPPVSDSNYTYEDQTPIDVDAFSLQSEPVEADLSSLDVGSLDIYSMSAAMGLITHEEAKTMSPDAEMSRKEAALHDTNGDGHLDATEWRRLISNAGS